MNMSFALTRDQFLNGTKTVTRRNGWWNIQAGQTHMGVEKSQGLKKGEKVVKLGQFMVILPRAERLSLLLDNPEYGAQEVILEGFPDLTPQQFVDMFMKTHKGVTVDSLINRIEFVRVWPEV